MDFSYNEDRLPAGQSLIWTSNVQALFTCTQFLIDSADLYPTIGGVTAPAGVGKSIAAQVCQETIERQFQSVLPVTLKVKVMPRSTSRLLAIHILEHLGERARSDNSTQLIADAGQAVERNDVRLIMYDEGDRLNDDSFEVVRFLIDKTGCPSLVVGLPNILNVIERQDKFSSRVSLRVAFEPLSLKEVLDDVLPQLVFPQWSFDPKNEQDRAMGEELWKRVCPSLRKLRNVLTLASITATAKKETKITLPLINEVLRWVMSQEDRSKEKRQNRQTTQRELGSHEQRSVEKQQAKDMKGDEGKKGDEASNG